MKNVFSYLIICALFISCQPKSIVGLYSTAQPEVMSFVNQQLRLNEDGTFAYSYSSDDLRSNQKGKGNFQYSDRKLVLNFESKEPGQTFISKNQASSRHQNVLKLLVQDLDQQPLIGVTLTLRDLENKILNRGITNKNGYGVLQWKKDQTPGSIEASYIGFSNIIAPLDPESALDYTINLSHSYQPIQEGTVWEYSAKKIRQEKLVLTRDNRTSTYLKVKQ